MRNHGKGPKLVFVPRYPRWKSGRREIVGEARRGQIAEFAGERSISLMRGSEAAN
jgi:hypothetical protein